MRLKVILISGVAVMPFQDPRAKKLEIVQMFCLWTCMGAVSYYIRDI